MVGYDGSPAARAAIALSVQRVSPSGHLYIVHGYKLPDDHLGSLYYDDIVAEATRRAAELIEGAAARLG